MKQRPGSPCPDPKCTGSLHQDEYGVYCALCGAETDTWAEPADADEPVRLEDGPPAAPVLLPGRTARTGRHRAAIALAAVVLLGAGAGIWWKLRPTEIQAHHEVKLQVADLLVAIRQQHWPHDAHLPAYYHDPELFLLKRHRSAQSPNVVLWNSLNRATKLSLLREIGELRSPAAFPLLAELAWFTLGTEADREIASLLFGAMLSSSHAYVDVAIFVCDFVNQTAQDDEIAAHAAESSAALLDRRRRLGY
jgi:hypothetical protein